MSEEQRLSAGFIDFNHKRMTKEEAEKFGIPVALQDHVADWRQYPLHIASHFPTGVSWFSKKHPWFFRQEFSDPRHTEQLRESDVLILSGSGMSAYRFQEQPENYYSPEDVQYLEKAQHTVRDHLGQGKWVLGICFGGQLAIQAVGGIIGRLPKNVTEAGWLEHELTPAGQQDEVMGHLPETFFAPHFHNDFVQQLAPVGTAVHASGGDITVIKAEVLAVRRGYLDTDGVKNGDMAYIMASVVEFDNGARLYQIQPHPEMATPVKASFLVRMNPWLAKEDEMGRSYYQQASSVPPDADYGVAKVIPRFIESAKKHLEELRGVHFVEAMLVQELFRYLLP